MNQNKFTERVALLLGDGWGAEDIAMSLDCNLQHVRNEIEILRGEGRLERLRGNTRWGPTALRLMT